MNIKDLYINGFRNLEDVHISFENNKNLIYGKNGAGKTSVLEALFLLGFRKSFLNVGIKDIVNYNFKEFFIRSSINNRIRGVFDLQAEYKKNKLKLLISDKETNIVYINDYYYPLFFSSSNYTQYIESNFLLRKLIDRFIFGISKNYYSELVNYNRGLKNKNALLKNNFNDMEISSWNRVLAEVSERITKIRADFVLELNKILVNHKKNIKLEYIPSVGDKQTIENIFEKYENIKNKEIILKRTLMGIHLDKYIIKINNKNLKYFSSGEKKIGLLILYLSYIELFNLFKNDYPVFFTDDFDIAIDQANIDFLLNEYPNIQVIATSVNKNKNFDNYIEIN